MRSQARTTNECSGTFNRYETIRRLPINHLMIHAIPGEEWTLSCAIHKTLLVDVYSLTNVKGSGVTYRCGRLCEILLKVLWYGRRVQYHVHGGVSAEGNVLSYTRNVRMYRRRGQTLEEETYSLLRGGDLRFHVSPGQVWRLTNSCFGQSLLSGFDLFRFVEEQTLGTPDPHMYTSTTLEHVLLEHLCQGATWLESSTLPKVLDFNKWRHV